MEKKSRIAATILALAMSCSPMVVQAGAQGEGRRRVPRPRSRDRVMVWMVRMADRAGVASGGPRDRMVAADRWVAGGAGAVEWGILAWVGGHGASGDGRSGIWSGRLSE